MYGEQPTFPKSSNNVSYLSRRPSGTHLVSRPSQNAAPSSDTISSLKVKQYLNKLAKEERKNPPAPCTQARTTRSTSVDYVSPRVFEYRIETRRSSDTPSYHHVNYDTSILKPVALKPLVITDRDTLSTDLFIPGSIPTNKEIDVIVEELRRARARTASENFRRPSAAAMSRRHSDSSHLLSRERKRSIKDKPNHSLRRFSTTPDSNCSRERSRSHSSDSFRSTKSAFSVPERRTTLTPPKCNSIEEEDVPSPPLSPLSEDDSLPSVSPVVVSPKLPPRSGMSPKQRTKSPPKEDPLIEAVRKASVVIPVIDLTAELKALSPTKEDFKLQHSLIRKARYRHRICSQPCNLSCPSESSDDQRQCAGKHPPVSYFNTVRRSKSLQLNTQAAKDLEAFKTLHASKRKEVKLKKLRDEEDRKKIHIRGSKTSLHNTPNGCLKPASSNNGFSIQNPAYPKSIPEVEVLRNPVDTKQPSQHKCTRPPPLERLPSLERPALKPVEASSSHCNPPRKACLHPVISDSEVDQVKSVLKEVGRKYLSEDAQKKEHDIENNPSLSFVFSGNKELQNKVRTFFQQTNKDLCKRMIKQRFDSNPTTLTPDSSVKDDESQIDFSIEDEDAITRRNSKNLDESIKSFIVRSENFIPNKSQNHNEFEKFKKEKEDLSEILNGIRVGVRPPSSSRSLSASSAGNGRTGSGNTFKTPLTPKQDNNQDHGSNSLKRSNTYSNFMRPKYHSNGDDTSVNFVLRRNSSKTSRDSGYGDSTSASNEGLNPTPKRGRSASLTILSKLKPLFKMNKLKSKDSLTKEDNPFSNIITDYPISDLAKSLDNLIITRSHPDMTQDDFLPSEEEEVSVFGSPANTPPLEDFSLSCPLEDDSLPLSDFDEEFCVSPLPDHEMLLSPVCCEEEQGINNLLRKSLEALNEIPFNEFSLEDIQEILDSFDALQCRAPADNEYHRVHNLLESKVTVSLSSIYHTLLNSVVPEDLTVNQAIPVHKEAIEMLDDIPGVEENEEAIELIGILESLEVLLELHDEVMSRRYYENESLPEVPSSRNNALGAAGDNVGSSIYRMVGLHKNQEEPLGITLKKEENKILVARIMTGGMIDKQCLLHIGDEIKEINGQKVDAKPDVIQNMLRDLEGDIQLKIIPSYKEQAPVCQIYVKAHFKYDPKDDDLIPCKEAGLGFDKGDILQIVNQDDEKWWQARLEGGEGQAGLIPGRILQERRTACEKKAAAGIAGCYSSSKKKRKMMYYATKNSDFDQHELTIYEEVAKMPPFQRKTLVLIGAQGVGRRSLISKLVLNDPERFGNTMPHTSRPPRSNEKDGCGYWFTSRNKMDKDIANHKYLEYGEYENHLYGTKLDSIRQVMRSGKMCLLDVHPQALKVLKTSEFMPYIVFIEAPQYETLCRMHKESQRDNPAKTFTDTDLHKSIEESLRLKRQYSHFFDVIIQNNDMDLTYKKLYECINQLSTEPQWVPVSWVY